jgi:hypothetical protein
MNEIMHGVTEYAEGLDVRLQLEDNGRLIVSAWNEGGFNGTSIDLLELLVWLRNNRPDLIRETK